MNLIHHGNITCLTEGTAIHTQLPTETYDLQTNPNTGAFEMHHRPSFTLPDKIYGGHDGFAERCIKTFTELGRGMAVLLSGPKGCGKTLTAKKIASISNLPVICISSGFCGPSFNEFLTELPNPVVIFIDEFEKVYREETRRNSLLTILDGAAHNKHLFILTSNSSKIGEFFSNRPGRVRYHRKYKDLGTDVLKEMVDDQMPDGPNKAAVHAFLEERGSISPDALMSLISECIIHNEPPSAFMSYFNIQTELSGSWDVTIKTNGYRENPGLSKEEKEEAQDFLNALRDDGEERATAWYPEGKLHCKQVEEVWTANYSYPFRNCDSKFGFEADVAYATRPGSQATRRFTVQPHQVESITRSSGAIVTKLHNGIVMHFTKVDMPEPGY